MDKEERRAAFLRLFQRERKSGKAHREATKTALEALDRVGLVSAPAKQLTKAEKKLKEK